MELMYRFRMSRLISNFSTLLTKARDLLTATKASSNKGS